MDLHYCRGCIFGLPETLKKKTTVQKMKERITFYNILKSCYLHHAGGNMITIHAIGPIILHCKITVKGVSPSTPLPPNLPWWQSSERSPLLVIELTSFPKYQKPCWIIKYVYTGVHISSRSQTLQRPEYRAVFVVLWAQKKWKVYFFHSQTFIWSRLLNTPLPPTSIPTNLPLCPNGRLALFGDSRT